MFALFTHEIKSDHRQMFTIVVSFGLVNVKATIENNEILTSPYLDDTTHLLQIIGIAIVNCSNTILWRRRFFFLFNKRTPEKIHKTKDNRIGPRKICEKKIELNIKRKPRPQTVE